MSRFSESNTNLRQFDLNLLPILKALLSTHSVARSAEILGLSQSATSGALTRLRATFGDPLLILIGRNLVPTPRAIELKAYVDVAFSSLFDLFDQRVFAAAQEERCYVISTSDYVVGELAVPLAKLVTDEAPAVSVRFVEVSPLHMTSVEGGEIDFMVTPMMAAEPPPDIRALPLMEDSMVIISSARSSIPAAGLDLETYLASRHVTYGVAGSETFEQRAVAARGLAKRDLIIVPQFNLLPEFVQRIDCLAMMPRHIAMRLKERFDLRIFEVPFEMPRLRLALYWSVLLDKSPPHIWFREMIRRAWQDAQSNNVSAA